MVGPVHPALLHWIECTLSFCFHILHTTTTASHLPSFPLQYVFTLLLPSVALHQLTSLCALVPADLTTQITMAEEAASQTFEVGEIPPSNDTEQMLTTPCFACYRVPLQVPLSPSPCRSVSLLSLSLLPQPASQSSQNFTTIYLRAPFQRVSNSRSEVPCTIIR